MKNRYENALKLNIALVYGVCGSRNHGRIGGRATDVKNGNAGPKLHWRLWGKSVFSALLCDKVY